MSNESIKKVLIGTSTDSKVTVTH